MVRLLAMCAVAGAGVLYIALIVSPQQDPEDSAPEVSLYGWATQSGLVTILDIEFADLRMYPPGTHPGIVLFRPRSLGATTVNEFVEAFVRQTDLDALAGCVVVVDSARVRVRQP